MIKNYSNNINNTNNYNNIKSIYSNNYNSRVNDFNKTVYNNIRCN